MSIRIARTSDRFYAKNVEISFISDFFGRICMFWSSKLGWNSSIKIDWSSQNQMHNQTAIHQHTFVIREVSG